MWEERGTKTERVKRKEKLSRPMRNIHPDTKKQRDIVVSKTREEVMEKCGASLRKS